MQTIVRQTEKVQANGQLLKERTLIFDTKEKLEDLLIAGMHDVKRYKLQLA